MRISPGTGCRPLSRVLLVALSALLLPACEGSFRTPPDAPFACRDEDWDAARINPHRFIAHAGGALDGRRYTNALEAMDRSYERGLRLLEMDLIETRDGRLVGAHDWQGWREATGSTSEVPTHREFMERALFGRYQPVDLAALDRWFADRPDAYLVTDKVTDYEALLDGFSHRERLIVEVFGIDDYRRARALGVEHAMLSLGPSVRKAGVERVRAFLAEEPVKFVAVASKRIDRFRDLLGDLRRSGTCVYTFTTSDEAFLRERFSGLVYGAYTDDWDVRAGGCAGGPCATY